MNKTIVWGTAADSSGLVQHSRVEGETLPGGGMRAWKHVETMVEPATAYASVHPAPMPMKWHHDEDIGRVVALRRAHGSLHAVAECELEPDELQSLTDRFGDLKMSTGTFNGRREALKITEISLTPSPASIGLPKVHWWKLNVIKGNLPQWVSDALVRARKTEYRSRGELRVHETEPPVVRDAGAEYEQMGRDLGMLPHEYRYKEYSYKDPLTGEEVEVFIRPGGRILSVGGRPVRY